MRETTSITARGRRHDPLVRPSPRRRTAGPAGRRAACASFDGATSWLNSEPLTPEGLRGRVVLVDFWTYTCVNWLRTLPYRRAWAAKYAEAGLTVVGVHTPEFGFERDLDNVVPRTRALGVEYPVAVDSDYGVWRAFDNHFWPAIYLADARGAHPLPPFRRGRVRDDRDGRPAAVDRRRGEGRRPGPGRRRAEGLEVAADWRTLRSPETYVGYGQATGFASADVAAFDQPHAYARDRGAPAQLLGPHGDLDRRPARRDPRTSRAGASPSSSRPATSTS